VSAAELIGAVLAGGESRRFGRDKAAEPIRGKPMVVRGAETLAEVFEHVVIVSSREPVVPDWPHVRDRRPGHGPLAAIETALLDAARAGREGAFVLACDLPLVDAAVVRSVVAGADGAPACAPSRPAHPGIEPLCAVYRTVCLPAVTDALDRGRRSVHAAFAAVGGVVVEIPDDVFLNVNTAQDAERAKIALSAGGRRGTRAVR